MQLRPAIQIQSVVKAMSDVILPALDPANPLAQEQARLCIGHLSVIAARLSLQYRYDCDELGRLLALARSVQQLPGADALAPRSLTSVADGARRGEDVLARARAEPGELVEAVQALRALTSQLLQEAFENDPSGRVSDELQRLVMDASREQLLRERAWLKVQGWEPDPDGIPAIETLLAAVHTAQ